MLVNVGVSVGISDGVGVGAKVKVRVGSVVKVFVKDAEGFSVAVFVGAAISA